MYAVIRTGGKQYKVEENKPIFVEKLAAEEGQDVTFDQVLLVGSRSITIGTPTIEGAKVTGTVEKQGREKKVDSTEGGYLCCRVNYAAITDHDQLIAVRTLMDSCYQISTSLAANYSDFIKIDLQN